MSNIQNFSDIAGLFLQLGCSGITAAVLFLLMGTLGKWGWVYDVGVFFTCASFVGFFLGDNFGGGFLVLVLEVLIVMGLLKFKAWRFRKAVTPAPATPVVVVTPAVPAVPTAPVAPVSPPATSINWGNWIFWGILLALVASSFSGTQGFSFPGSNFTDPWVYKLGSAFFFSALSKNETINAGYQAILLGLIILAVLRLFWKK